MRFSIRTLLTIPFVCLTLAPVTVVGLLFYRNSQIAIRESVDDLFEQVASRTEDQIKRYISTPQFINQLNANAIEQGLLQIDDLAFDSDQIEEYFVEQFQATYRASQSFSGLEEVNSNEFQGSVNHIYIGTTGGIFRGAEYRTDPADPNQKIIAISRGEIDPETGEGTLRQVRTNSDKKILDESEYRLFERPWYTGAIDKWESANSNPSSETSLAGWTRFYCDQSTQQPAITAFRPVSLNGELVGVLGSDLLFNDIQAFLRRLLGNLNIEEGHILVVNDARNQLLISASRGNESGNESNNNSFTAQAQECDPGSEITLDNSDPTINEIFNKLTNVSPANTSTSTTGLNTINVQGETYFWRSVEIADGYGLKISVLIAIPEASFTEEIRESTQTTVALALFTLVLTGILGLLIARWITQPVLQLEAATKELTHAIDSDDQSLTILEIDNPSELHALANTFGSMSTQLRDLFIAFNHFVPQNFLHVLGCDNATQVRLGTYNRIKMTILFSDIRSFTALNETLKPDESFRFINNYFSRMEPAINQNHGFIDKYMGDGIMALFQGDNSSDNAVKAALEMLQALEKYNDYRIQVGRRPIEIGIGVHTGEITLGTLGGRNRWDTTVIGRNVNRASRVEGLTKEFGSRFLASQQLIDSLQQDYHHRFVGAATVKGVEEPMKIYEIYEADPFELRDRKIKTAPIFQTGLKLYSEQDYAWALEKFEAVLADCSNDGAAQYYARQCQYHLETKR